jgi:hypothetical protein
MVDVDSQRSSRNRDRDIVRDPNDLKTSRFRPDATMHRSWVDQEVILLSDPTLSFGHRKTGAFHKPLLA